MEVKVNFPTRVKNAYKAKVVFEEAKQFYESNKQYVDKSIYDYFFANAGPDLNPDIVFNVSVLNVSKRILDLYFRFKGCTNQNIEVVLSAVIYKKASPPLPEESPPGSGNEDKFLKSN